jgi:hypothetical protein
MNSNQHPNTTPATRARSSSTSSSAADHTGVAAARSSVAGRGRRWPSLTVALPATDHGDLSCERIIYVAALAAKPCS